MTVTAVLTEDERAETITDLEETRALKLRCLGEIRRQRDTRVATVSSIHKLDLIVDACRRWEDRYTKALA